jgi:hypothetical protein
MRDETITVITFDASKFDAAKFDAASWHDPRIRSHVVPVQKRGKPA